ncbi:MAG: NAD(P)H-quinone oxidoreductase [Arachnia sp.]
MRVVSVSEPGGVANLSIVDAAPPIPEADEILVRAVASGVNRADLLQRRGHYPPPPGTTDTLGLEASGVVEAVGADVTRWRPGDEVVALLAGGGYAEQFVVPAGSAVPPPPGVDLVTAAGVLEVAATVASNFATVGLAAGETVLIHGGAGGIGTFATQYAAALGCRVAATAGTPAKLEHCREYGTDIALDYHEDWVAGLMAATQSHGADVILDIMGAKYLELNVAALAARGRMVTIGLQGGVKGTLNLGLLLKKMATLTATSVRLRSVAEKSAICTLVEEQVWPMLGSGQVLPAPTTRFDFDQVRAAHEYLDSGTNIGKVVLVHSGR